MHLTAYVSRCIFGACFICSPPMNSPTGSPRSTTPAPRTWRPRSRSSNSSARSKPRPGSRESLLWYEHPSASRFEEAHSFAWELEAWGSFRDYARRVIEHLESRRFVSRLESLPPAAAEAVLRSIKRIQRASDPRARWELKLRGVPLSPSIGRPEGAHAHTRSAASTSPPSRRRASRSPTCRPTRWRSASSRSGFRRRASACSTA